MHLFCLWFWIWLLSFSVFPPVIYTICKDLDLDFAAMFAMTGIWNSVFLVIYSLVGASRLMKWSTRSTEEIFALFISIAFTVDTCKDIYSGNQTISGMNYPLLKMQSSSTSAWTYLIDLSCPNRSHGKAKIHLFFFLFCQILKSTTTTPTVMRKSPWVMPLQKSSNPQRTACWLP